jgi:Tol biopolymer transport system component
MFSPDGTKLLFSSTRNAAGPHEFNIFIADWVP